MTRHRRQPSRRKTQWMPAHADEQRQEQPSPEGAPERTADLAGDHGDGADSDPSGRGGVRSRSSVGTAGYGGQPGVGGYEQGFHGAQKAGAVDADGPAVGDTRVVKESGQWRSVRPDGRTIDDGQEVAQADACGHAPGPDGLGAIVSSTDSGDGTDVAAGRIVADPGSVDRSKP